jgi:transcriptional regulator with XRE-family HTH domain
VRVVRKCLIPKPYDFVPKTVGEHIKRERLKRGLRQTDIAPLFGVDAFTILNWETGFTKPQIKDVPTLISFLGYDPEPPPLETIADHLYATRRRLGWSQKRTASYLGIDPCTLSSWELGGTIMKPEHRTLVAALTGLRVDHVYRCMKKQWNKAHGVKCSEEAPLEGASNP